MQRGSNYYGEGNWHHAPNEFSMPDYLELQKDVRDQLRHFEKLGISPKDLLEAWEKCGVRGIEFKSAFMFSPRRGWGGIEGMEGAPRGWEERYGSNVGYLLTIQKEELSEIREAVKELTKEYPDGWGIKIKPKEFYRVLFFHEVAHTLPICGRFLNELAAMKAEERMKFEQEAWFWAVRMAREKNLKIRILYPSVKKENKLEHSNFCQWYQLLKRDNEIKRARAMKKAA